jgi:hypothetical protein
MRSFLLGLLFLLLPPLLRAEAPPVISFDQGLLSKPPLGTRSIQANQRQHPLQTTH